MKFLYRLIKPLLPKFIRKKLLYIYYVPQKIINFVYAFFLRFRKNIFNFNGQTYKYFIAPYNTTWRNERAIEIPIIYSFLKNKKQDVLEIGNVLSHYFKVDHDIVDKYEKKKNVKNCDILEFLSSKKYNLIISISTFEHIGFDEDNRYGCGDENINKENLLLAINKSKDLLVDGGVFVFSVPLGFNSFLDSKIESNELGLSEMFFFNCISSDNEWI
jgi:hypothetical protein